MHPKEREFTVYIYLYTFWRKFCARSSREQVTQDKKCSLRIKTKKKN